MKKTKNTSDSHQQKSEFLTVFNGKFFGVLRWQQLDDLWQVVKKDKEQGWYIYAVGEPLPVNKKTGESVNSYVDELNQLLRREHDEDYCGVVYTDSFEKPRLIKVFDPNNLGTSCSIASQDQWRCHPRYLPQLTTRPRWQALQIRSGSTRR